MLRSLSALIFWFLRAWPVLSFAPIALAHASAHRLFPAEAVFVNKVTGTVLQVVGGLIVIYSVNSNLGLFRNQHFGNIVLGWFRSFPLCRRTITLSASGIASATAFGSARVCVRRTTSTIDEKVAELERQLEEIRQHVSEDFLAANERISQVHSKLSTALGANTATLNHIASKLELVTVGGFKQQAFGVLLAVYGAVTSLFA